ncbi:MAG: heme ABC exporter ATP-binding protein CcmA [Actinomycetota bacterium]|nr:heme ABC exporter ATP-binding protein CcmA [Actinomycetota bacterium]
MSAVVNFREVVAVAGGFPVLAGLDIEIVKGEIVHLRGSNGAGKTSFMRVCAGLIPVRAGDANVLGFDMRDDRRSPRRYIGLLGHDNHLYKDLWVLEHLEFRAAATGADAGDVSAALLRLGLPDRLWSVPIERLSAGQRRRVAIASMLVGRPQLWLLDEPHAALDHEGRELLDEILVEAASSGATVVFASHERDLSKSVATRVVTLQGGRLLEDSGAA